MIVWPPLILLAACLAAASSAASASAQGRTPTPPEPAPQATTDTAARASADETFDLDIGERRINRSDFEASTAVEAGESSARGLNLRVGVGVGARQIDVLLRNVRGRVRFRANLEQVLHRINARRTANPIP